MNCAEAARLIDPYMDGELDLTASVNFEGHLAECPACREKFQQRQAFARFVREEAPRFKASPFLATRIKAALRAEAPDVEETSWWQSLTNSWIYSGLGGAVALVALCLFFFGSNRPSQIPQDAIANHIRSLQVSHLTDIASTDQHTVKPWFAGKLDYSPQVIDLGPSGYLLIGGRLDVLDHRNVAALIYQRRKHYINLFVWPVEKSPVGDNAYEQDGYHVFEWSKSGMNYVAVSELGEKELREFSQMIKDQSVPPME